MSGEFVTGEAAERAIAQTAALAEEHGGILAFHEHEDRVHFAPEVLIARTHKDDPARVVLQIGNQVWLIRRDQWDELELQEFDDDEGLSE
jgi:L-ascorbate metabolism protein UlaG (beta-lactamase superfamily)